MMSCRKVDTLQPHQPWSRIPAAFCIQCLYTTVSPCIHTVGTHAPAAYSDVAANTTAIPTTIVMYLGLGTRH